MQSALERIHSNEKWRSEGLKAYTNYSDSYYMYIKENWEAGYGPAPQKWEQQQSSH